MAGCDCQLKEAAEQEGKLELVALHNSRDATIQELKARMAEKDAALTQEQTRAAEVET